MRSIMRALCCALALAFPASALAEEKATFSFVFENDFFGGTDQGYSNGLKVSYVSPAGRGRKIARLVLRAKPEDTVRFGVSAGQSIFTPEDTDTPEPMPDDHPYAGWLHIEGVSIVERREGPIDILTVAAGVVGPASLAEETQRTIHRFINDDDVLGWDNQLRNEPGLIASFDRIWRPLRVDSGVAWDILPHAGVSVGNVITEARAGATLRIGNDLHENYGQARVAPSYPTGGFHGSKAPRWQVFAGGQARGVARKIFLDGNTYRDSLSVDKKHFVGDLFFGGAIQLLDGVQVAYTHTFRTREFQGQKKKLDFGSFTVSGSF